MAPINKKLKLGVIGMSEGNGHPYSWSAIFNGFNMDFMKDCPFPVIPEYLSREKYPENFLGFLAEVTHIWTQDVKISNHISQASKIPFVVSNPEDMIDHIDAVLLARDDAENHLKMAEPFIRAGLPIFIDKPFALSVDEANKMWNMQQFENQIFTCSSLRFASELIPNKNDYKILGKVSYIEASIPKSWEKYAVHIIEPIIVAFPNRGNLLNVTTFKQDQIVNLKVRWENISASITTYGNYKMPLEIRYFGDKEIINKTLLFTFNAFKISLSQFIKQVINNNNLIPRKETLEIISIIEKGTK